MTEGPSRCAVISTEQSYKAQDILRITFEDGCITAANCKWVHQVHRWTCEHKSPFKSKEIVPGFLIWCAQCRLCFANTLTKPTNSSVVHTGCEQAFKTKYPGVPYTVMPCPKCGDKGIIAWSSHSKALGAQTGMVGCSGCNPDPEPPGR